MAEPISELDGEREGMSVQRVGDFTLRPEAMDNSGDHRDCDVGCSGDRYVVMRGIEEVAEGVVDRMGFATDDSSCSKESREVKKGQNLAFPVGADVKYGKNPDNEVGKWEEKAKRLADDVFKMLSGRIDGIATVIANRDGVEKIKALMSDDARFDHVMHRLDRGTFATITPAECEKLRLSCNGVNVKGLNTGGRLGFLQRFVYSLDRRLRFALYAKAGNRYPKVDYYYNEDGSRCADELHPSFKYNFDENGLSVGFRLRPLDNGQGMGPHSWIYLGGERGCNEVIDLSINGGDQPFSVNSFLEIERQKRGQDPDTV